MSSDCTHFVVYESPRDFPGRFVVREWLIVGERQIPVDPPIAIVDTIEAARDAIAPGLYCIERFADDDPAIVEVWL